MKFISHVTSGMMKENLPSLLMKKKKSAISDSMASTNGLLNGINATDQPDFLSGKLFKIMQTVN